MILFQKQSKNRIFLSRYGNKEELEKYAKYLNNGYQFVLNLKLSVYFQLVVILLNFLTLSKYKKRSNVVSNSLSTYCIFFKSNNLDICCCSGITLHQKCQKKLLTYIVLCVKICQEIFQLLGAAYMRGGTGRKTE